MAPWSLIRSLAFGGDGRECTPTVAAKGLLVKVLDATRSLHRSNGISALCTVCYEKLLSGLASQKVPVPGGSPDARLVHPPDFYL